MILKRGSKIGVIACSNGRLSSSRLEWEELYKKLAGKYGLEVVQADTIYAHANSIYSGSAEERANELHKLYLNKEIEMIFDISGGDVANQILPFLDFKLLSENPKPFVGYSDLTTILNGIYAVAGQPGVLFHLNHDLSQFERCFMEGEPSGLVGDFIAGAPNLAGTLIGGNIRCFLKLAGTKFMPDFKQKIILFEALSGNEAKMATYIAQYEQLGAFSQCKGLLLGQFTEAEEQGFRPQIDRLFIEVGEKYGIPVFKTNQIGHSSDAVPIPIGAEIFIGK
ncbi:MULTISPECIES: LD-carboxypeptidase [Listeria]|uniref:LD-carboxypeptidase n=1 Tax=Listeria TaxID=1637 RepID=UPI000B58F355|nr:MULTISPECIES: LD-carboxypeptidase [Listeria]